MSEPTGERMRMENGKLVVPSNPVVPFIIGDGTGPDIWHASQIVMDAAVEKAYKGGRKIFWKEVLAGEKALISLEIGCLRKRWRHFGSIW